VLHTKVANKSHITLVERDIETAVVGVGAKTPLDEDAILTFPVGVDSRLVLDPGGRLVVQSDLATVAVRSGSTEDTGLEVTATRDAVADTLAVGAS
jgi:hypothetical protein